MKRLTLRDLKQAPDYEELKWHHAAPIVVAAFGETWKRLAGPRDFEDSDYFVVADSDEEDDFSGTYADDEPIEPSD